MSLAYPAALFKYSDTADSSASITENSDTMEKAQTVLASQLAGLDHDQTIAFLKTNSLYYSKVAPYRAYLQHDLNARPSLWKAYLSASTDSTESEELDGDECLGYDPKSSLELRLARTTTGTADMDPELGEMDLPSNVTTEDNIFRIDSNKSPEEAFSAFCGILLRDIPALGNAFNGSRVAGYQPVDAESDNCPELVGGWHREKYFKRQQEIKDRYHESNKRGGDSENDNNQGESGSGEGNGKSGESSDDSSSGDEDANLEPATPPSSRRPWKSKLFPDGKIPISKLINPIPPWEITHRGQPLSAFAVKPTLRVEYFCHTDPYCILPNNHSTVHKYSLDEGDHGDTDFQLVAYLDEIGKRPVPFAPLSMLRIPNGITLKHFPTEDTRTIWVYEQGSSNDSDPYTPKVYRHHRLLVRRNPDGSVTSLRWDGLCPYCKPTDICHIMGFGNLFYNIQSSDYRNHLAHQHGILPNGTLIKDPELYGWGRDARFEGTRGGYRVRVSFCEGVICPYDDCRQSIRIMPFLRSDPRSNRLRGYLGHCFDRHYHRTISASAFSFT